MFLNDDSLAGRPQHNQLWESVLAALRSAIITRRLAPGSHLVEMELAKKLNVSRGPVRDALIRLEQEGLVVHHPYRGKFVAELSVNYIREIYSLRLLLENFALELAIERFQTEQFERLQELLDLMMVELAAGHFEEFADVDIEFHRQLVALTEHKALLQMWETLTNVIHAFIAINASGQPMLARTISEGHTAILRALAERDLAAAKEALRVHLMTAEANILQMMEQEQRD